MELEDIFVKIQGLLNSADKTVGPLSELKARCGNEQKILTVASQLNKLLVQNNYLSKKQEHLNDDMLRKITFFLILNCDLQDEENLKDESNVGHLVSLCPKLTPCLVLDCIWGLNLDCYLGEILAHGPATLTLELLKYVITSIRFSSPYPLLGRLQMLIYSIYTKIYQLQHDRIYFYKLEHMLSELLQKAVELLQQYINPNFLKLDDWTENEMYRYTGYAMESIFKLSNDCFDIFINKPNISNDKYKLYNIEYKIGAEFHPSLAQRQEKIFKILSKINTCLLQCCIGNLKAISVEIYCSWVEFKLDNNKTLQQTVANYAYIINEKLPKLNLDADFLTELSGMFSSIAIKPLNLNEEINESDLDTVIKNIQMKNDDQKLWFKRFLTFEQIFTDPKCFTLLKENVNLSDAEDVDLLLKLISNQNHTIKNFEEIKELGIRSLISLSTEDQIKVIESYFKTYGLNNLFERPNFNTCLTETFNKTISAEILNSVSELMLQNPKAVLQLLVDDCFKSKPKADLMMPLMKSFKQLYDIPVSNNGETSEHNETFGINLLKQSCDQFSCSTQEIEKFVYALKNIVDSDIIPPSDVAESILFPKIHKFMNEKNYGNVLFWLEGCKAICLHENFFNLYMTFLLFLAQILKHCRTDINNFSVDKISILEVTIQMIKSIVQKIITNKLLKEEDVDYLKNQWLQKEPVQNRYYFEPLWNNENSSFLKYLFFGCLSDHTRTWNISRLLELLPFLTLDEWKVLSKDILEERPDALEYFQMLIDFLNLLISVVAQSNTQSTLSCLEYCIKNFTIILNDIVCPKIDSYNAQLVLWEAVFQLIKILPKEIKENCCLKLIKILMPLLQNLKEKNADVYGITSLDLVLIENTDACQLICKKMLEQ